MKGAQRVSITNALIWAMALLAVAVLFRETEYAGRVVIMLSGAAVASIIFVDNAMRFARIVRN